MKIGVLTSSRADYGIYLPLIKKIKDDDYFDLEIIAFGTHLSKSHGYTLSEIEKENYKKTHCISSLISNDDEQGIATSYALTALKFADFWQQNKFDLVFCLGDRFEMCAAVQASIPFNLKFAHFHGGETTLGAIDNIYRHQITLASSLHFSANEIFSKRIIELIGKKDNVFTVGSLSLNGIERYQPIEKTEFYEKFKLYNEDFALITFHPETVNSKMNKQFANEMRKALTHLASKLFLVITMPNADTMGSFFRKEIAQLEDEFSDQVLCIENFGKEYYFSAMYYAKLLIGNTSSGIIEAASFGKYVVNVGDRQKGRLQSDNVINAPFSKQEIIEAFDKALVRECYTGKNNYYNQNSADLIIKQIKQFNEVV
ncbi:UDP-N-acetylglucosamine 2-epimerase [Flavobacterium sp.]|jgi:GDP/UDP-N,N'-diacetylbacillosamine 2-epimerase (hydrolysing)|uniref:UDP-N-acetylglucosamine 2-epimerase n=1 Tax=Flavobacterium sp. TaxID=239 RepID=UPI0037C06940